MKGRLLGGVLSLVAAVGSQGRFTTGTQDVLVDVSVTQGKKAVAGLGRGDFQLTDNGVLQQCDLANGTWPLDLTIVLDSSSLVDRLGANFTRDLERIVPLLTERDRLRVITFATEVREVRAMTFLPASGASPLSPGWSETSRPSAKERSDPRNYSALSDALILALARQVDATRRHLVLLFTAGVDDASALKFDDMIVDVAQRSEATLLVALWPGWHSPTAGGWTLSPLSFVSYTESLLTEAAVVTGGSLEIVTNGTSALSDLLRDARQRYLLHYSVQGIPTSGWHTIDVRVPSRPGVLVKHRKGYLGR